jgi:hypothetical protein
MTKPISPLRRRMIDDMTIRKRISPAGAAPVHERGRGLPEVAAREAHCRRRAHLRFHEPQPADSNRSLSTFEPVSVRDWEFRREKA